jgi:AhpD family alkylhydroperoxidase
MFVAAGALGTFAAAAAPPASTPSTEARATYQDIEGTLGSVPGFFKAFPEDAISGAWEEMKNLQLNPSTAVPGKYKELMGLAVSAQVPCRYCTYFHTQAAKLNGASEAEIKDALAVSSLVRHWSTFTNGMQADETTFKGDVDRALDHVKTAMSGEAAEGGSHLTMITTDAASAKSEITKTFGFVPTFMQTFPEPALNGAWKEMKAVEMNPRGAIPGKYRDLIALGVAAQVPCRYCAYFHSQAATTLGGASQQELAEAVGVASIVRHWSTYLNGIQYDEARFRQEVDKVMAHLRQPTIGQAGMGK